MTQSTVRAEASLWIVRLHGPQRSPTLEAGFQKWLAASSEHRREFERVNEIWDSVGGLTNSGAPRTARWTHSAPRQRFAWAAAILLGLFGFGGWVVWRSLPPSYATAIGEQRTLTLDDGTRVSLNSRSTVDIDYSQAQRRVTLRNGEAYFEVAHDAVRPFTVIAGQQQVRSLGTAFIVRYEDQGVAIALLEGKISVQSGESAPTTLTPGERLVVMEHETPKRDKPRMEVVTAWRRGEVVLQDTRLLDALTEMNRYSRKVLVLGEPGLADLRVSGVYKAGDSPSFARATAKIFDLEVIEQEQEITLRRPAP